MKFVFFIFIIFFYCSKTDKQKLLLYNTLGQQYSFGIQLPANSFGKTFRFTLTAIDFSKNQSVPYLDQTVYLQVFESITNWNSNHNIIQLNTSFNVTGKTVYLSGYEDTNLNNIPDADEVSFGIKTNPIVISNYYQVFYYPEWTKQIKITFCNPKESEVECSLFNGIEYNTNTQKYSLENWFNKGVTKTNQIIIATDTNTKIYGSCEAKTSKGSTVSTFWKESQDQNNIAKPEALTISEILNGITINRWWNENLKYRQECIEEPQLYDFKIENLCNNQKKCSNGNTIKIYCSTFRKVEFAGGYKYNALDFITESNDNGTNQLTIKVERNKQVYGTCFIDLDCNGIYTSDSTGKGTEPSFWWKEKDAIPQPVSTNDGYLISPEWWIPSYNNKKDCYP